jgi:hypothetical protein
MAPIFERKNPRDKREIKFGKKSVGLKLSFMQKLGLADTDKFTESLFAG